MGPSKSHGKGIVNFGSPTTSAGEHQYAYRASDGGDNLLGVGGSNPAQGLGPFDESEPCDFRNAQFFSGDMGPN